MKKYFFIIISLVVFNIAISQNVGIGTVTTNSSAKCDVTSNNSGFLPPRMTTAQRNAIVNPSPGLIIFNTSTNSLEIFVGNGWGGLTVSQPIVKKLFGGTGDDEAYDIRQTTDGGYIVAGYSTSSSNGDISTANHGGMDCWIVK